MSHLSKDQLEEIARSLASRAKKDTDFVSTDSLTDEDYVAIVQDGKNKKVKVSHFESHSSTEWGTELNHEADLKVKGTTKRLLKTSAISTSDKNVDVVTDPEAVAMMKVLGIYMEI